MDIDADNFLSTVPNRVIHAIENSSSSHTQQNLFQLQKLQKNIFEYPKEEIQTFSFLETLIHPWIKESKDKSLTLFIYIDPNLPQKLTLDKENLSFVLQELLYNAIKFTPKDGSIHLDVRQNFVNKQEGLSFSISDSGIGIPKSKISKLFRSYLGKSNTGFSLGLAACHFLLHALGSELKISSELSKGSRFSFSLPFWTEERPSLSPKKSLYIGIMQEDSLMDSYTRQLFSYLLALGSKLISVNSPNDPKISQCQVLFIVNKTFSRRQREAIHKDHPDCIIIPAILEKYHKEYTVFKRDQSYKILFPLLPSAMLDCYAYIASEIALQKMQQDPNLEERLNPHERNQNSEEVNETLQILLVEDNAINIKWTLMLLGRYDYDIDYTENGEIAVTKVKQKHFDLILMDIDMPIMNGIEATQHIKAFEKRNHLTHTPIIALTSHDQEGQREEILAQGLDDHLGKPLKITELEALLGVFKILCQHRVIPKILS